MHTDPVSDLLTRIRNGSRAHLHEVDVPASTIKQRVAELLMELGYLRAVRRIPEGPQGTIRITLKYDTHGQAVICGLRRLSRPGLRRYHRVHEFPVIQSGFGSILLTTSKGVLTDKTAKELGVGGEALCAVW